jgi:hypothetical protein
VYQPIPAGVFSHDEPLTNPPTEIAIESGEPIWVMLPVSMPPTAPSLTGTVEETATPNDKDD